MGKEIEVTQQYLAELEKWNIFKNEVKIVKKWKGKEYAGEFTKQQILRRLVCLVVIIPGAIAFFLKPSSNMNVVILFITLLIYDFCILLANSRGVKKEVEKQQAYLEQLIKVK